MQPAERPPVRSPEGRKEMNNDKMVTVKMTRSDLCRLMLLVSAVKWKFIREADFEKDSEEKTRLLSYTTVCDEMHDKLQKARDDFDEKNT